MSEISKRFSTLISTLGGEPLNPEDIEWALDVPAGKQLLNWLTAQLNENEGGASSSIVCSQGVLQRQAAALHAIALTGEELSMCVCFLPYPFELFSEIKT